MREASPGDSPMLDYQRSNNNPAPETNMKYTVDRFCERMSAAAVSISIIILIKSRFGYFNPETSGTSRLRAARSLDA